ncbi:hypothetical protein MTP03_43600 [Tsukamurella sp. PLM1]|nr:hypothetical protein MTP03_43600 [Tsukamurella sp. PLM1]
MRSGRAVADDTMTSVMRDATVVSKPTNWEDDRRAKWDKTMQYMFDEMKNNPNTDTFKKVKAAADTRNSTMSLALGGNPQFESAGALFEVFAPGRTWDHKPKIQNLTNTYTEDGLYFQPPYGDNTVYYDFFSNVHYGYIMNLAGWPLDETIKGQDVPVLSGKQSPWDTMASQAGWELAQREGRDLTWGEYNQAIQSLVQQFEAAQAAGTTMTNLRPSGQY